VHVDPLQGGFRENFTQEKPGVAQEKTDIPPACPADPFGSLIDAPERDLDAEMKHVWVQPGTVKKEITVAETDLNDTVPERKGLEPVIGTSRASWIKERFLQEVTHQSPPSRCGSIIRKRDQPASPSSSPRILVKQFGLLTGPPKEGTIPSVFGT
jgi:hypothetical protein